MSKSTSNKGGGKTSSSKSFGKKTTSFTKGASQVNPSKPAVDTHKGAHDTVSKQNPTLNENGTIKMGHGHKQYSSDQLSKMGSDKQLSKLYAKKYKNK